MKTLDHILRDKLHDHTAPPPEGAGEEVLFQAALRGKLYGHAQQPPAGVWEGIEQALLSVIGSPRRPRPLWTRVVRYAAAACLLVAAGVGGWRLLQESPENTNPQPLVATTDTAEAPQHLLAQRAVEGNDTPTVAISRQNAISARRMEVAAIDIASRKIVADIPAIDVAGEAPHVDPLPAHEGVAPAHAIATLSSDAPTARAAWLPIRSRRQGAMRGASLYASNYAANPATSPGSANPPSNSAEFTSRATDATIRATPAAPDPQPVSHRAPISLGAEITFDLAPHVRLHTGLAYNYLRSDFDQPIASTDQRIRQHLHYVGVPIAVSYDFYSTPRVDFYVRGGGTLEKGIYGVRKGPGGNNRLKLSGLQPSVAAAAGVEIALGGMTGIYIEPGMVYYPTLESQPVSYRTDHPLTFSLRAGVRINLGR